MHEQSEYSDEPIEPKTDKDAMRAFGILAGWPQCRDCGAVERYMRKYRQYHEPREVVYLCARCRGKPSIGKTLMRARY